MVLIPAGQFVMGDDKGEDDEKPAHRVAVSAFYMDVTEVTQDSFQQCWAGTPLNGTAPDNRWSA